MRQQLVRAWLEIRRGQNVEIYLVLVLCTGLLFSSLFRAPTQTELGSGLLATLLLLAVGYLRMSRTTATLRELLERLDSGCRSSTFFQEWDDSRFKERLRSAREIWQQAISSYQFMNGNEAGISALLRRGGRYRCILLDPDGKAVSMAARRNAGAAQEIAYITQQLYLAKLKLREFSEAGHAEAVEVRMIDHLTEPIMTVLDPNEADGLMFVTLSGYRAPWPSRPSFVLHRTYDSHWFEFYLRSFESYWNSPETRDVDLSKVDQVASLQV